MPISELPFRSVGPEPAMITTTGTRPVAPRGMTSVPPNSRAPLWIGYGDSSATAGAMVSAVCTLMATSMRLRTVMFFPLPEDVRLHDRDHRHDENRCDEQGQERAWRQKGTGRDDESPEDHQPAAGAMRLPPDRITGQGPGGANAHEPVGLDTCEVVAQDDEKQPDADRHGPADLHGIPEAGRNDHPMPDENEQDHGIRDQPIRADELGVVRPPR